MTDFAGQLTAEIASLRRYAHALTRDTSSADDLVQSCLLRAIDKQHLWQQGTSLRCWLFTMLHNLQVSRVRRAAREQRCRAAIAALALTRHEPRSVVDMVDAERAIAQLPDWQQQVLLLIGVNEMSYAQAAAKLGLREGTVRSRLGRARASLRRLTGVEAVKIATDADSHFVSAAVADAAAGGRKAQRQVD